jgi:hypothetical protein
VEWGAGIQIKHIGNVFNEDIIENFPNLGTNINTNVCEAFWNLNTYKKKKQFYIIP